MTNDENPMTKQMPGEFDVIDIPALGMWFFLAGEAMFFVGLLGSFVVLESAGGQHDIFVKSSDTLSRGCGITGVILLLISSLALWRNRLVSHWIAAFSAIVFIIVQGLQWESLLHRQYGPWRDNFFASYFLFSAAHGVHVMVGIGLLLGYMIRASGSSEYLRDRRGGGNQLPVTVQMYWHFVNAIGVLGFFVLYFVR